MKKQKIISIVLASAILILILGGLAWWLLSRENKVPRTFPETGTCAKEKDSLHKFKSNE